MSYCATCHGDGWVVSDRGTIRCVCNPEPPPARKETDEEVREDIRRLIREGNEEQEALVFTLASALLAQISDSTVDIQQALAALDFVRALVEQRQP